MALTPNINDREKQKFRGDSPDNVWVAVGLVDPDTGDPIVAELQPVISGSATTTAADQPPAEGEPILWFLLHNLSVDSNLLVSMDGGTSFKKVLSRDSIELCIGNSDDVKQLKIKSESGSADFEMIYRTKRA